MRSWAEARESTRTLSRSLRRPQQVRTVEEDIMCHLFLLGRPVEVHGWADNLRLGQVSAVDINMDNDPVIFQRGSTVWDESSFAANNVLNKK